MDYPEVTGCKLQHIYCIPVYMVLYPKALNSSSTLLWDLWLWHWSFLLPWLSQPFIAGCRCHQSAGWTKKCWKSAAESWDIKQGV